MEIVPGAVLDLNIPSAGPKQAALPDEKPSEFGNPLGPSPAPGPNQSSSLALPAGSVRSDDRTAQRAKVLPPLPSPRERVSSASPAVKTPPPQKPLPPLPASRVSPTLTGSAESETAMPPSSPRRRANTDEYHMAGAIKPTREGHSFEQFLVVGIPHTADLSKVPARYEPQILYQWPSALRVKTTQIEHFCFPNGVEAAVVRRTPSCSSLNEIMHAPSHSHNSLIFLLTGENTFLYGICVTRPEFLSDYPSFFPLSRKPLPHQPSYVVANRCYCLITRFPFFRLHFDILHQILSVERLLRMELPTFDSPVPPSPAPTAPTEDPQTPTNVPALGLAIAGPAPGPVPQGDAHLGEVASGEARALVTTSDLPIRPPPAASRPAWSEHPVVGILRAFHEAAVPKPGESLVLRLADSVQAAGLQNIPPFYCPPGDEDAKLLGDWCLAGLFRCLSLENILYIFAGLLQEKPVAFVSKNLSLLTHASLSVVPMLRPFVWQGMVFGLKRPEFLLGLFIPILPHILADYVEAPVPFIVGMQRPPDRPRPDILIVLLDQNKLLPPVGDRLPEGAKLLSNLRNDHRLLYKPGTPYNPYHLSTEQLAAVQNILGTLHAYLDWLLQRIRPHYAQYDLGSANKEEVRASFVNSVSVPNRPFISALLNTQLFSQYLDLYIKRGKPAKT